MMTVLVPPTSFIAGSTITTINIIITIFGRELHFDCDNQGNHLRHLSRKEKNQKRNK
jgi:hypothetical protein